MVFRPAREPYERKQVVKAGSPASMKLKKRQAQDKVLELLAKGHTIGEAIEMVGRRRPTYYTWCDTEPWFKNRADAIRKREPGENAGFVDFRQRYFGFETPGHQHQIISAIEKAVPGSITMILLPPGGGKTTVLEDWFNYKLANDPGYRIAVISETATLGRKILGNVQNRMTDETLCPAYIKDFGPFRASDRSQNKPWNAGFFTHVQAKSGERDYSMEVKGAGSAIYGASFDVAVLDDIQSQETLTKTEALLTYFRNTLYSRVMRANSTGKIIIIGTRQGSGDFYEELLRDNIVDELVQIPALDEHGHSYFPERTTADGRVIGYSEERLAKIREVVRELAWSRQYMQEPISALGQTFAEALLERAKNPLRGITLGAPNNPGLYRVGTIDPALGGHCVVRTMSFDYEKLYLLDGSNRKGLANYDQIWDEMERLQIKWHCNAWVIEANALQGGLSKSERVKDMAKKYGFTLHPHQTGKNKQDDQIGVASMASSFIRDGIDIPWGDDEAKECFAPLIDQLRKWRPDIPTKLLVQDEVMAFWFGHLFWQKMRVKFASRIDSNVRRPGLPWSPSRYVPIGASNRVLA